jgi:POT family proton-dependent oligopeptide transporter
LYVTHNSVAFINLPHAIFQIFIPIFDLVLYPYLRRKNIRFTPLKRITAGFFCATLAMIWACITQVYIYRMSPCGDEANNCSDPITGNVSRLI